MHLGFFLTEKSLSVNKTIESFAQGLLHESDNLINVLIQKTKAFLEPCLTFTMELFATIVNS